MAASLLLSALESRRSVLREAPLAAAKALTEQEVHVAATDSVYPYIGEDLLQALREDPRVERLATAISVRAVDMPGTAEGALDEERFYSMEGNGMGGWIPGRRENFLAWTSDANYANLVEGAWPSKNSGAAIEIASLQIWRQPVGTWRRLESDSGVFPAKIVGTVAVDMALLATPEGARILSRQVSPVAAATLAGGSRLPSDARLHLAKGTDRAAFVSEWRSKTRSLPGRLEFWDSDFLLKSALQSTSVESARLAVISAALLAAACVVCIALGVQGSAVRERAEQVRLLRALGANPATMFAAMFAEAAVLAFAAVIGATIIAWGVMSLLSMVFPFLGGGGMPSAVNVMLTAAVVLGGTLLGTTWPALSAARIWSGKANGLAADAAGASQLYWRSAICGAFILAAIFYVVTILPANSLLRARVAAWIGVPGVALAAICMTPVAIWVVGRLFARPVAWLSKTNSLVLADQVAGDGARSAGVVLAMSVGLGGFLWMLSWGYSMLGCFIIDPQVPRWLLSIHPYGLDQKETEAVLATPQFKRFQPLTLVDTRLEPHDAAVPTVPTLVMGVELDRAFTGVDALPFRFVAGDPQRAVEQLESGNSCLISDWYAASTGIGVGDQIAVAVPSAAGNAVQNYQVAGIVELRGWRMATKQNKVRLRGDKHRAMVVLDANIVRREFPVAFANYLIGSADSPSLWFHAGTTGEQAFADSNRNRQALETAVGQVIDLGRALEYRPDGGQPVQTTRRVAQVDDLDRTRYELLGNWGGGAVKRLGILPLVILALSLTSLSSGLVVSFLSRARELGILRTCGLTRLALARLCVAVGLLLGIAAVPIAAVIGLGGAWLMLEVASVVGYRLDFAGIQPALDIPWHWLWPGILLTLLVSCIAGIWAAWRIGRVSPDALLTNYSGMR
ncbi:MAG: ABC transporter permease [Pirellulales bacterium]